MNILKLEDMYTLSVGKYIFSLNNGILPSKLAQTAVINQDVHSYNTRNKDYPHIQMRRTGTACRSNRYSGPTVWYNLPNEIKNLKRIKSFTNKLKKYCICKYTEYA